MNTLLPFLREARKDPLWAYNWYAQLQCSLVFNPWTRDTDGSPTGLSGGGSRSRRSAHKVGRINLHFVAPACAHLL